MKKLPISLAALLLVLLCGCAAARKAREIDAALAAAQIPVEKVEAESSQTEKAESEQAQPEQLEAEPPITFSAEDAHAAEKSEPAPIYDKAPEVCATAVFLDGAELTAYVHEEALYLRLRDYDAATGSSCAIEPWEWKKNVWLCTAVLSDGTSRRISTEEQLLYDGTEGYVPLETLLFWTDGWMLPDSARESLYCSTRPRIKELPGAIVCRCSCTMRSAMTAGAHRRSSSHRRVWRSSLPIWSTTGIHRSGLRICRTSIKSKSRSY